MRPTTLMIAAAVLGLSAALPSLAQNGLQVPVAATNWPQWQGRLALPLTAQNVNDGSRWRGSSLFGDYYFYRHPTTSATSPLGGFRATSGLMFGNATARLTMGVGTEFSSVHGLGFSRALLGLQTSGLFNEKDNTTNYLGLGYTLVSLRGGWGVSADIGLASISRLNPRFGAGPGLAQSGLEDGLRDLRLTPLLQLGLSYSF